MARRRLIGAGMFLAGLLLLLPPAWALFSPFLMQLVGTNPAAGVTWLVATLGGAALLGLGVRRMLPLRGPW